MDEKRTPNGNELYGIEILAALDAQLNERIKYLEARLKSVPDLYRQYRIAQTAVGKVVDGLYTTVPQKTLIHMQKLCASGEIVIRQKPAVRYDDVRFALMSDLKDIANVVVANECAICLRDAREQRKCKLRKAMERVMPVDKVHEDGCQYRAVAESHEYGEYI